MFKTKFSPWDAVAATCVLLLAALLFLIPLLGAEEGSVLVISTPDGAKEYSLDQDQTITVESNGIRLEIVIEDGEAYVKSSDCPDGVCRSGGRIGKSGESILCAPAGVTLTVKGGKSDVDFVAG